MGLFDFLKSQSVEQMQHAGNIEGLIKALNHNQTHIRQSAAKALGDLKNVTAIEPLIQALNDNSADVQLSAAQSLTNFVDPRISQVRSRIDNLLRTAPTSISKSDDAQYETILIKADRLMLCAFLIESNPDASIGAFQRTVLLQASDDELKEIIRSQCHCSGADVLIIPPAAWTPPAFRSVSQQELTQNFPAVLSRAESFLKRNGRADLNVQMLSKTGVVMPNPVNGKVFFVFKIEPLISIDASSVKQAFLFHDKGHEQMKSGQLKNAYDSFEKAASLSDAIILADPKNPDAYYVKAVSSGLLGTIQMKLKGSVDKDFMPISMEAWKQLVAVAPPYYNGDRLRIAKTMLSKYS